MKIAFLKLYRQKPRPLPSAFPPKHRHKNLAGPARFILQSIALLTKSKIHYHSQMERRLCEQCASFWGTCKYLNVVMYDKRIKKKFAKQSSTNTKPAKAPQKPEAHIVTYRLTYIVHGQQLQLLCYAGCHLERNVLWEIITWTVEELGFTLHFGSVAVLDALLIQRLTQRGVAQMQISRGDRSTQNVLVSQRQPIPHICF